jgi:hypothetical protein
MRLEGGDNMKYYTLNNTGEITGTHDGTTGLEGSKTEDGSILKVIDWNRPCSICSLPLHDQEEVHSDCYDQLMEDWA